jgi:hypothetical protein
MRLESARGLKAQLLKEVVEPLAVANRLVGRGAVPFAVGARPLDTLPRIPRSLALGITRSQGEYKLAVRIQRPSLLQSPLIDQLTRRANGEVEVRIIGRIDKRAKARRAPRGAGAAVAVLPWYQQNTRPLLIGASVGHVDITAGTLGAFVTRGKATYLLSNNHVFANEDRASAADWILQRAAYDGGKQPSERVARLRFWIKLKTSGANVVDAALAEVDKNVPYDVSRLRGLIDGLDRKLTGVASAPVDEGDAVFKVGRTTGPTAGRITAFELDNVVVNYDSGNLRFDNQVEIEGTGRASFSDGGDSGSLIVSADFKAVALLFAGGDSGGSNGLGLTYANPIDQVFSNLKATLLF